MSPVVVNLSNEELDRLASKHILGLEVQEFPADEPLRYGCLSPCHATWRDVMSQAAREHLVISCKIGKKGPEYTTDFHGWRIRCEIPRRDFDLETVPDHIAFTTSSFNWTEEVFITPAPPAPVTTDPTACFQLMEKMQADDHMLEIAVSGGAGGCSYARYDFGFDRESQTLFRAVVLAALARIAPEALGLEQDSIWDVLLDSGMDESLSGGTQP